LFDCLAGWWWMLNPISVRNDPMGKLGGAQKELWEFSRKRLKKKKKKLQ